MLLTLALAACGGGGDSPDTTGPARTLEQREAEDACAALDKARATPGGLTSAEALRFGETLAVAAETAAEPVASAAGAMLADIESGQPSGGAQKMQNACNKIRAAP